MTSVVMNPGRNMLPVFSWVFNDNVEWIK